MAPLVFCQCVCEPPLCILGSALRSAALQGRGFRGGWPGVVGCGWLGKKTTDRPTFGFWDWYFGFGLGVATNGTLLQLQSLPQSALASLPASTAACCCLSHRPLKPTFWRLLCACSFSFFMHFFRPCQPHA